MRNGADTHEEGSGVGVCSFTAEAIAAAHALARIKDSFQAGRRGRIRFLQTQGAFLTATKQRTAFKSTMSKMFRSYSRNHSSLPLWHDLCSQSQRGWPLRTRRSASQTSLRNPSYCANPSPYRLGRRQRAGEKGHPYTPNTGADP